MKSFKMVCCALIFLASVILGQQIISLSMVNQEHKKDYAEINNIKYGLFSINEWKRQLSEIINAEVADFDITGNKDELKPLVEAQLNKLIDGVNERIQEKNKKTFKGRMKQAFINTFVDMKDVKAGIPKYADEVIQLISKPKTKKNIKGLLLDKVDDYFDKTFKEQDLAPIDAIIQRLNATDISDAKVKLNDIIAHNHSKISIMTWLLLALVTLLFVIAGLTNGPVPSFHYILLVLSLFILLICGVTTPMIDLEAKISEMSFVLMDHPVQFLNQILYFQTKSVVDVFWLMITDPHIQMKIVGILMVVFSIVFPVTKLLSCLLYYYDHRGLQKNRVIQFFVHKSGKWSMTDVMIIAIFMAYIGFNGVISSQFGKLHSAQDEIVLLTTNGTSLQPGFYLFLGYAMLALFLSELLNRKFKTPNGAGSI